MTKIHHATIKKASDNQIEMKDVSDTQTEATYTTKAGFQVSALSVLPPKALLDLMLLRKTLAEEYPVIDVTHVDGGYILIIREDQEELDAYWESLPDLADVLEQAAGLEVDLNPIEDTPDDSGSIVGARYKQAYAERGNANNCGDWLAHFLEQALTIDLIEAVDGNKPKKIKRFDWEAFRDLLELNGVDFSGKWASLPESGQKGWVGRYRMNGRQKLEIMVAVAGVLKTPVGDATPDADWLAEMRTKHAKALAKVAKGAPATPANDA